MLWAWRVWELTQKRIFQVCYEHEELENCFVRVHNKGLINLLCKYIMITYCGYFCIYSTHQLGNQFFCVEQCVPSNRKFISRVQGTETCFCTLLTYGAEPFLRSCQLCSHSELSGILRNPKVHHRVHKSPPLVPILSQIDPVHPIPSYFSEIHSVRSCFVTEFLSLNFSLQYLLYLYMYLFLSNLWFNRLIDHVLSLIL
jgi:hypothetical protein